MANILGVGIAELFAEPAFDNCAVQGYLECKDGIHKVAGIDDLLSAESSVLGMINIPVYSDVKRLQKQVKDFIYHCIKWKEDVTFMTSRIDHRELFHLCRDGNQQKFLLTIMSKKQSILSTCLSTEIRMMDSALMD